MKQGGSVDERLTLEAFSALRGPDTHYTLHVKMHLDPRFAFVRERLLPDANRLIIVLRDTAGHEYRLTYFAAETLLGTWQLRSVSPCEAAHVDGAELTSGPSKA